MSVPKNMQQPLGHPTAYMEARARLEAKKRRAERIKYLCRIGMTEDAATRTADEELADGGEEQE